MRQNLQKAAEIIIANFSTLKFPHRTRFSTAYSWAEASLFEDANFVDDISWDNTKNLLVDLLGKEWEDFDSDLSYFTWGEGEELDSGHRGDVKRILQLILDDLISDTKLEDFL